MIKRIKANPFLSIVVGFVFGTYAAIALAQTVDNINRVWNGVHTFNAPVTFADTVTGLTLQAVDLQTLTVDGASTLTGAVSMGSTLAVTGISTLTGAVTASDTLTVDGTSTLTGVVDMPDSFGVGSADFTEAELEVLDGITTGTAAASKALVLNSSSGITTGIEAFAIGGDVTLGDNEIDEITANGRIIQNVARQEFNQSCRVAKNDYTAEAGGDAEIDLVWCPGGGPNEGITMFEFRTDGAQSSPFLVDGAGGLDIDNDGIANEGVEIVVASTSAPAGAVVDVGTSPAKYFQWGMTIASIDGADSYGGGWRLNSAYVDNMVLATINTGAQFAYTTDTGVCNIVTEDDTADGVDLITACDVSDAEEIHFRIEVATDGGFTFYQAATEAALESATVITESNATGAAATGDQLVPFLWLLQDTAADSEIKILYVEIGEVL